MLTAFPSEHLRCVQMIRIANVPVMQIFLLVPGHAARHESPRFGSLLRIKHNHVTHPARTHVPAHSLIGRIATSSHTNTQNDDVQTTTSSCWSRPVFLVLSPRFPPAYLPVCSPTYLLRRAGVAGVYRGRFAASQAPRHRADVSP